MRKITVVPYDPLWEQSFSQEAGALSTLLGETVIAIHHVGSTAVPGMSAKPIVDILMVVHDLQDVDKLETEFTRRGYLPRGENGIPGRRYLIKGTRELRSHHIHIFAGGHPAIESLLAVRDFLHQDPAARVEYSILKEELARRFPTDREGYVRGKEAYILSLTNRALDWRAMDGDV